MRRNDRKRVLLWVLDDGYWGVEKSIVPCYQRQCGRGKISEEVWHGRLRTAVPSGFSLVLVGGSTNWKSVRAVTNNTYPHIRGNESTSSFHERLDRTKYTVITTSESKRSFEVLIFETDA
jgi:hypothetical protein